MEVLERLTSGYPDDNSVQTDFIDMIGKEFCSAYLDFWS